MINWFATYFIILYAILFGITMKIADLFNEHGLKEWFKGSRILFGFLWGIFGALLVISNAHVANVILAMILAFILRFRIDYLNHGIATSMTLITFFLTSRFELSIFIPFFLIFAIFGLTEDYLSEKSKKKIKIPKRLPFYSLSGLIYLIFTGNWAIFFVLFFYELAYVITDMKGMKIIKKQRKDGT